MSMSKQELSQAFREVASLEFAEVPCDNSQIKHSLPKNFEERMNALIKQMSEESEKLPKDSSEIDSH